LESRHRPEECPPLADPTFAAQRQALTEMLDLVNDTSEERNLNAL
jgi:hypothetical protein